MNETFYLSGKILKRSLPCLSPPAPTDAPLLKRLLLPNGELAQLHDSDQPIHYIAMIELREGSARGNHYHLKKEEWVYLSQGAVRLVVEDIATRQRESLAVEPGDLVRIPPGVAHTFHVIRSGNALEFSPRRFDPEDTRRHLLA